MTQSEALKFGCVVQCAASYVSKQGSVCACGIGAETAGSKDRTISSCSPPWTTSSRRVRPSNDAFPFVCVTPHGQATTAAPRRGLSDRAPYGYGRRG